MGWFNRFTKKNRAPRPNAVTTAQTRRIGSVAAREQVRKANNKSGASGSMLAKYNKTANNVQKGRNTVAARASAAYDRIKAAVERQKSGKNSYKNAMEALEDEIDSKEKAELKDKVKDMEDQFNAATKKVIEDYMDDIKAQAVEFSKDKDLNLRDKLKDALIKIMAGDMSAPEPKIKKILVFILPIFLLIAPYISKLYKKFKYNPGDEIYDRLRVFVDAMKSEKVGGANNERATYSSGNNWHSNLFFSAAMINMSMGDGGVDNPIMGIILVIIFAYFAIIVSITVGIFIFDILLMIKRAIFDNVKKAQITGSVSEELKRAAPQVALVTQNPLRQNNRPKNVRPPAPGLPPPINHKGVTPSKWVTIIENGERWYENVVTGETSWELPEGAVTIPIAEYAK